MTRDERLEKLRKQIAAVAEKDKRLDETLRSHKKAPERGDIYLFDLDAIPEDAAVFWVILHCHPKDSKLFYTVPADTNPLEGVFDVSIPHTALFGSLVLRLGQGLWMPDSLFKPSQRVGIVETLFIDRAQFIMSRIAKNEWIGSDMQQATEANPDYEEWMEMINQVYGTMRTYREKFILEQVRTEVPVKVAWSIDNVINLEKVKETLFEYLVTPFIPSPSFHYLVSPIGASRGTTKEERSEKSNMYVVGESFGFRVEMPEDGYLTIFDYTENRNIKLIFPERPEDESCLSGGNKKTIFCIAKKPLGKHFLRAIWTAQPLIEITSVDLAIETEKNNIGMKLIDRLIQLGKDDNQQTVYEYDVEEQ